MASCTYFPLRSSSTSLNPVALPPGRDRLSTRPIPMGLPTLMKTMGVVDPWRFAANDATVPVGTSILAPRWSNALTTSGTSDSLRIHTTSSTTCWFSIRPTSRRPRRNASTNERSCALDGEPGGRKPIRAGLPACCASAVSGGREMARPRRIASATPRVITECADSTVRTQSDSSCPRRRL